jgi:hypothetical protein
MMAGSVFMINRNKKMRGSIMSTRSYLIDPGYIEPQTRHVIGHIQKKGNYETRDILEGLSVNITDHTMNIEIPAGSMRIINVTEK